MQARVGWCALAGHLLALAFANPLEAQQTGRTIRIIYAFAAGNSGDGLTRILADRLGARLGVPVIVENRAGASGRLGTRAVVAADPDGATLLLAPMGPIALHPIVYSNLDFEPFKDLAPISQVATFDLALSVGPGAKATTLRELVDWLKAAPEKANYGTPGLGGLPHFFAIMFSTSSGIKLHNVPYRGSATVVTDLISGQLPVAVVPTADNVELHRSGRVRILATSATARSPFVADVPTFKEAGYDIAGEGWFGLYAGEDADRHARPIEHRGAANHARARRA